MNKKYYSKHELKNKALELLEKRGVKLSDMTVIVMKLQEKYIPDLTEERVERTLHSILEKREVQNAIFTGIELDRLAEEGLVQEPLLSMLQMDDGLYGIDEIIPLGIVNIYGTIGLSNFGYLDITKPGIIGLLDRKSGDGKIHVFLDDIVCALCAAACSRLAHRDRDRLLGEE